MDLTISRDGDVVIATVAGRLDGATAPAHQETIEHAIRETDRALILGMESTDYISSAGLRAVLLVSKKLATQRGKLVLYGLSANIREAFIISGFDKIVSIADNREAARVLLD